LKILISFHQFYSNSYGRQQTAPENQSVKLTFTRTAGAADSNSPHVIVMTNEHGDHNYSGTYTITTLGGFTSPSHVDLTIDTGVSSNHDKPLVNGAIYTVKCEYTPSGSSAKYVENTGFTYDTSTQSPTLDLPSPNQTIKQTFTVQYDQPETAYAGTVKLTFTRTTGTADTGSPHVLEVDSEASGTNKTLSLDGSDLDGSTGVTVSSGGNFLVNGTTYTVKIEYQDEAQNTAASDQNAGVDYDNATVAPTLDAPVTDQTVAQNFTVQYDQPETAYANSVKLTFTRSGGSSDSGSPHVLVIDSEASGSDITLSIDGDDLGSTTGATYSGSDLVNGTVYTVKIEYQDEAQNTVASDDNTGITFDTSTVEPTLDSPTANQSIGQNFTVQYDQPETAYSSTVKLTFTRTAGSADGDSPHVLEVDSETSGDNKSLTINGADLGGSTGVSLSSGGNALVDDAIYTVKIEYQDLAQNTAADDQNSGVTYDISGLLLVSGSDYNIGEGFAPDTDNNAFFILELQKSTSGGNATVDAIDFDLTGSFDNSDIDAIKIWRSTNNSFNSGTDTQLISVSSGFDPFEADFDPNESIGETKVYYFLTVDVSSTASGTDNIGAQITAAIDITADITVSGTFPISGDDHPLPVTLASFVVQMHGREPNLLWITQSESNNAFWNIYRSDSGDLSQAFQLNVENEILGQGTTTTPTDYVYTDKFPVDPNTTYWYWLESIAYNGATELIGPVAITIHYNGDLDAPNVPISYGLHQNYPNPFNPSTSISFILPYGSIVELAVFNIKDKISFMLEF